MLPDSTGKFVMRVRTDADGAAQAETNATGRRVEVVDLGSTVTFVPRTVQEVTTYSFLGIHGFTFSQLKSPTYSSPYSPSPQSPMSQYIHRLGPNYNPQISEPSSNSGQMTTTPGAGSSRTPVGTSSQRPALPFLNQIQAAGGNVAAAQGLVTHPGTPVTSVGGWPTPPGGGTPASGMGLPGSNPATWGPQTPVSGNTVPYVAQPTYLNPIGGLPNSNPINAAILANRQYTGPATPNSGAGSGAWGPPSTNSTNTWSTGWSTPSYPPGFGYPVSGGLPSGSLPPISNTSIPPASGSSLPPLSNTSIPPASGGSSIYPPSVTSTVKAVIKEEETNILLIGAGLAGVVALVLMLQK